MQTSLPDSAHKVFKAVQIMIGDSLLIIKQKRFVYEGKKKMQQPRSLALEFQETYLQLAALHLHTHGKKLYVQDCHIEMVQDWLSKQKKQLAGRS